MLQEGEGYMRIYLSEIKKVSEVLLNYLNESGRDYLDLNNDYYWFIDKKEVYDPYNEPVSSNCTLGQLTDDWKNLKKIGDKEDEPIGYALVWLASILRAIGEDVP